MARRVLHDEYFRKAKAEGYLARSAYKLIEINDRKRLIAKGNRVLDLGCAPGSWLQVAAKLVGPKGRVVGIDLKPVEASIGPQVVTLVGDLTAISAAELTAPVGSRYDAVICDMAPNTTGAGDDFRSVHLCRDVLAILPGVLRWGGNLTMKVLEGADYPLLLRETAALFSTARGFKPKASRDVSREIFIVAYDYRPPRPELDAQPDVGPAQP